ncbi:hypothetical protein RRG08_028918 [Elysia crispata]|uniref:Uncharacterized protein n=1 Tax=Elysia crispata TaxID=231223 RepID=A0AAE1AQD1_9GAST|nr:hypothetical protein RRG08_028918 [Elysia crispata]
MARPVDSSLYCLSDDRRHIVGWQGQVLWGLKDRSGAANQQNLSRHTSSRSIASSPKSMSAGAHSGKARSGKMYGAQLTQRECTFLVNHSSLWK